MQHIGLRDCHLLKLRFAKQSESYVCMGVDFFIPIDFVLFSSTIGQKKVVTRVPNSFRPPRNVQVRKQIDSQRVKKSGSVR